MACEHITFADGVTGIVCRTERRRRCAFCDAWSVKLCDGPPKPGSRRKTCDAPLCAAHATRGGPEIDYCPQHAGLAETERLGFCAGGCGV